MIGTKKTIIGSNYRHAAQKIDNRHNKKYLCQFFSFPFLIFHFSFLLFNCFGTEDEGTPSFFFAALRVLRGYFSGPARLFDIRQHVFLFVEYKYGCGQENHGQQKQRDNGLGNRGRLKLKSQYTVGSA